jgi:hypothetical protein
LLIGTVGVDAWLWWGDHTLFYYCGLSGILNSLLIVGLLQFWRDWRHPLILLTGVGAAVKILVEINAGQALLTQTAWPSVPTAHAAGFLCGLVLGWGFWITGARPFFRKVKTCAACFSRRSFTTVLWLVGSAGFGRRHKFRRCQNHTQITNAPVDLP